MTSIYFVRHAQPEETADDAARVLTAAGLADRNKLTAVFAGVRLDAAYCSDYIRSVQTIEELAKARGLDIQTDARLRERTCGARSGPLTKKRWADFAFTEDGGECLADVTARNIEVVREILAAHEGQNILVGTHGTALSTILHHYDDSFAVEDFFYLFNSLPYVVRLDFDGQAYLGREELYWNERGYPGIAKISTTVYFVRHAQPVKGWTDDRTRPLTEQGKQDRRAVADALRDVDIDAFISSPYARSYDTISLCAAERGMDIATDERLRERKVGINSSPHLAGRWADFDFCEEEGENLRSVQDRNMAALFEILDSHSGQTLVVGTHGTALSSILNYYDHTFGLDEFVRILHSLPYIVRLTFNGRECIGKAEVLKLDRGY